MVKKGIIKYFNLTKDNEIILSEDKIINSKICFDFLVDTINKSSFKLVKLIKTKNSFNELLLEDKIGGILKISFILRSISGAGWKDKPHIKRVQVPNVSNNLVETNNIELKSHFIIFGFYNFDNNPIFSAWDGKRYLFHKTIRSCYLNIETLQRGYDQKYIETINSSQKIWVFLPDKFDRFIESFISYDK